LFTFPILNSLYWASYIKYNLINFVMKLFKHCNEYTYTIESNNLHLVKIVVQPLEVTTFIHQFISKFSCITFIDIQRLNEACFPKTYCRIIIVRGGPMFMDFMGHPYPRIYMPTNMILFLIISTSPWPCFYFLLYLYRYYPTCSIY
jgi:hypothetical protein